MKTKDLVLRLKNLGFKFFSFIIALNILFVSCQKQDFNLRNNHSREGGEPLSSSQRLFDDGELVNIAVLHNNYLDTLFQLISIPDMVVEETDLLNTIIPFFNGYHDTIPELLEINAYLNAENIFTNQSINSSLTLSYLNDIKAIFNGISDTNLTNQNYYSSLILQLEAIINDVNFNLLEGYDKDAVVSMIELGKQTLYYWLPTSAGASGVGYNKVIEYMDYHHGPNYIPSKSLGEVLAETALADCISVAVLCTIIGFAGMVNPSLIGPTLFLYLGGSVATASFNALGRGLRDMM